MPDLAGVRGDPAARGVLRPAGRLRLHRLDGGRPRPIAAGQEQRQSWLSSFYFGDAAEDDGLKPLVDNLGDIDARDINSVDVGDGIVLRVGRYGPYIESPGEDGEAQRASVPDDVAPDELTVEKARELLGRPATPTASSAPTRPPGARSWSRRAASALRHRGAAGRRAEGRRSRARLAVRVDAARDRDAGRRAAAADAAPGGRRRPRTGEEITAQNGRYGPYLKRGTDSRSLTSEDQIFDITLEEALAIYAQPKRGARRRRRAAAARARR